MVMKRLRLRKTLRKRNILLIRPRVAGADTNVTAFGASGNITTFMYVQKLGTLTRYPTLPSTSLHH